MKVYYLAHPVSPQGTESVASNLADAEWWLVALQRANPRVAIIAPWIMEIRLGICDDSIPEDRILGLERCFGVAGMGVDGILVTGPRIGSGSLGEIRAAAGLRGTNVHRFRSRDQDLVLPRYSNYASIVAPTWLQQCRFGAAPESAAVVCAEILAAVERYR